MHVGKPRPTTTWTRSRLWNGWLCQGGDGQAGSRGPGSPGRHNSTPATPGRAGPRQWVGAGSLSPLSKEPWLASVPPACPAPSATPAHADTGEKPDPLLPSRQWRQRVCWLSATWCRFLPKLWGWAPFVTVNIYRRPRKGLATWYDAVFPGHTAEAGRALTSAWPFRGSSARAVTADQGRGTRLCEYGV